MAYTADSTAIHSWEKAAKDKPEKPEEPRLTQKAQRTQSPVPGVFEAASPLGSSPQSGLHNSLSAWPAHGSAFSA